MLRKGFIDRSIYFSRGASSANSWFSGGPCLTVQVQKYGVATAQNEQIWKQNKFSYKKQRVYTVYTVKKENYEELK